MRIDNTALNLIKRLCAGGYEAYCVGGCIRDVIMGHEPHDYDICTSALPEQTREIFAEYPVIDTGIKHGTVTVIADNKPFEITTYRVDGKYSDNRHPEGVEFTSNLCEDLKRRDFTMNAIAYDGKNIVDIFGGAEDIKKHIIRAVGIAGDRFEEDALRVLRALRFASRLGFTIEEDTAAALHKKAELLRNISSERIFEELKLILCGDYAGKILIEYRDVFAVVIPELIPCFDFEQNNPYHKYNVYEHIVHGVEGVQPTPELRLTMLFHDIGKPEVYTEDADGVGHFHGHAEVSADIAARVLNRLKCDNETKHTVTLLVKNHDNCPDTTEKSVKRLLCKIGGERFEDLLEIKKADNAAQSEKAKAEHRLYGETIAEIYGRIVEKNECFSLKNLAVNGRDLVPFMQGKDIGNALASCLEKVVDGELENSKNVLLGYIKENLS